jgi:MFS family permease
MFDNASGSSRLAIGKPLQVFRHRPFLIFWVGTCISNTGNWTENAAQSWAVTTQTVGNPHQGMLVEVLQFADFCPVLLLALLAGVISDRVNRKVWLITLQATACALGAGLAAAAFLERTTPWVVIVFTFLEGSSGLSMALFSFRSCPVLFRAPNWIVPSRSTESSSTWPGSAVRCWRPRSSEPSALPAPSPSMPAHSCRY